MKAVLDIRIKQLCKDGYTLTTATMTIDAKPDMICKIIDALRKIDGLEVE